jgi:hypothetical protein
MDLFSKKEKINRDAFNIDFNQGFYDGTTSSRPSISPVEQIGKDLRTVSLRTIVNKETRNDPIIRIDNRQLENYFINDKPDNRRPAIKTEYNVVTQRQEPLELITTYVSKRVSDKSGIQFAANRTGLRNSELRYNVQNTRSEFPYAETFYD